MQEWKASEKEAQKMTHDGAISVNLVTGETTHISDRPPEQDYSFADETASVLNRAADEVAGHVERHQTKKARRKRRDTFREGEAARDRPSSRLQFTEEERAAPELKKAIRKSDKAADKLDAAKAAVSVKPPGKEHGNLLSRPVQELKSTIHGEVSKVEGENSGVQAGHLGERQIEKAVGYGGRRGPGRGQGVPVRRLCGKKRRRDRADAYADYGPDAVLYLHVWGGTSGLVGSSYLSENADLTGAEAAYCEMEAELQEYLDTYESTHDYDEYHFDLNEIEHDPYVLLSILPTLHEGVFTLDEVQGDLEMLFEKQYILTETVTTETRYRTETRTAAESITRSARAAPTHASRASGRFLSPAPITSPHARKSVGIGVENGTKNVSV